MPVVMQSSTDGPKMTVAAAVKAPTLIPRRTLALMDNAFLIDALFRQGPPAPGGAVTYELNTPRYATRDPRVVAEFGEIPVVGVRAGQKRAIHTLKYGAALVVSQEMRDRNDVGTLNERMEILRNTFTRHYDRLFLGLLLDHADVPTQTVNTAWTADTGTTIRKDLAAAGSAISSAVIPGQSDQRFGYRADTLVIPETVEWGWLDNDEVNVPFQGGLADASLRYTGTLPKKFFGFNVLTSAELNGKNKALVLQKGLAGFISDERPMQATPMYEERKTETWRSDFTRMSAAELDNPLAVVILDGVES